MLQTVEKITLSLPINVVKVLKRQSKRGAYSSYVAEAILEKHRSDKRDKIKTLKGSMLVTPDYTLEKNKEITMLQKIIL